MKSLVIAVMLFFTFLNIISNLGCQAYQHIQKYLKINMSCIAAANRSPAIHFWVSY